MHDHLSLELKTLLVGLSDQEIRAGQKFLYAGASLYADEVADLLLPSVVCIAQDLAIRLGMDGFGYAFAVGSMKPGLPLRGERAPQASAMFMEVAPFVAEVFKGEVMDCRHDIVKVYEAAVRTFQPGFSLERDTNYNALAA